MEFHLTHISSIWLFIFDVITFSFYHFVKRIWKLMINLRDTKETQNFTVVIIIFITIIINYYYYYFNNIFNFFYFYFYLCK